MTRVIAAPNRPAELLYEFRRALAVEQLVNALWRECVALGRSDLWVAREYERRLGVPMSGTSADSVGGERASPRAPLSRTPAKPRVAR